METLIPEFNTLPMPDGSRPLFVEELERALGSPSNLLQLLMNPHLTPNEHNLLILIRFSEEHGQPKNPIKSIGQPLLKKIQ